MRDALFCLVGIIAALVGYVVVLVAMVFLGEDTFPEGYDPEDHP